MPLKSCNHEDFNFQIEKTKYFARILAMIKNSRHTAGSRILIEIHSKIKISADKAKSKDYEFHGKVINKLRITNHRFCAVIVVVIRHFHK